MITISHNDNSNRVYCQNRFDILVNGRPIDQYVKDKQTYVEGRDGSEFQLEFHNKSHARKKIVVTVDGINIITGKSDYNDGYVVNPWESINIPGWRINSNEVAKFVFSSVKKSYNQRSDGHDARNIGVIGCLVFEQDFPTTNTWDNLFDYRYRQNIPAGPITATYSTSIMSGSLMGSSIANLPLSKNLGTGYGDATKYDTTKVSYKFQSKPVTKFVLFYDSAEGLKKRGIFVNRAPFNQPDPFPGFNDDGVPPPVR